MPPIIGAAFFSSLLSFPFHTFMYSLLVDQIRADYFENPLLFICFRSVSSRQMESVPPDVLHTDTQLLKFSFKHLILKFYFKHWIMKHEVRAETLHPLARVSLSILSLSPHIQMEHFLHENLERRKARVETL